MARMVEEIAPRFGPEFRWEKVITKTLAGATRCLELSRDLGRPAPVPSVFINGRLAFDATPAAEDLVSFIQDVMAGRRP